MIGRGGWPGLLLLGMVDHWRVSRVQGRSWGVIALEKGRELLHRHVAIANDLVQKTGADDLSRMHGHDRAAAVFVAEEMMAPFDAKNSKTDLREGRN